MINSHRFLEWRTWPIDSWCTQCIGRRTYDAPPHPEGVCSSCAGTGTEMVPISELLK